MNQNDIKILKGDTLSCIAQLEAAMGAIEAAMTQADDRKEKPGLDLLIMLVPAMMTTMRAQSQLLQLELVKLAQYQQQSIVVPGRG